MGVAIRVGLDEFLNRPEREDDQREQLFDGEIIVSPGAKMSHAMIVTRLRRSLAKLEQTGYELANDFACIVGQSMLIPDLAAITRERIDRAVSSDGWLSGSPELVIEVSSPSNRNLLRKAEAYVEHGAQQVWIVNPALRSVTVVTKAGATEAATGESIEFAGVPVRVDSISPLEGVQPDEGERSLSMSFGRLAGALHFGDTAF